MTTPEESIDLVSPGSDESPPGREIDPKVLSEIGGLTLRARIVADSATAGTHRSRHLGTSAEFADHKEYAPGDNLRQLDWRAFARLDRDYIKRFEEEANLRGLLVVDTSRSMAYPENARERKRLTKLEYATTCAGALAYVLGRQGDAAGLAQFAESLEIRVPARARRGQLQELLSTLEGLEANGTTQLTSSIDTLTEGLTRRMMVLVFSDLLDGGISSLDALKRLRARKHDVVLFHVLDADEIDFPFEDSTLFVGMEDQSEVQIDARAIRNAYREEVGHFLAKAEATTRSARIEYILARTDVSPSRLLASFLARRTSMRATAR